MRPFLHSIALKKRNVGRESLLTRNTYTLPDVAQYRFTENLQLRLLYRDGRVTREKCLETVPKLSWDICSATKVARCVQGLRLYFYIKNTFL